MNKEYEQLKQIFDEFAKDNGFVEDVDDLTYWDKDKEVFMSIKLWFDIVKITLEYVFISSEHPFVRSGAYATYSFDVGSLRDVSLGEIFNKLKKELETWRAGNE